MWDMVTSAGHPAPRSDDNPRPPASCNRSLCSLLLHLYEMTDLVDHPAQLRGVLALDGLADPAEAERAQRVALLAVGAVRGLDLLDDHAHAGTSSSDAVSVAPFSPPRPSTRSTDRPRSVATSSGRRRPCRPAIVAFTRLIGFWVPSDLDRMSGIPAISSTARTPPPAMTPVPGEAGLRNTRPDP